MVDALYRRIIAARNDLHTQTIPVELWEDLRYVDGALSPRASYSVVFDERCRLIRPDGTVDDRFGVAVTGFRGSVHGKETGFHEGNGSLVST